MKNEYQQVPEFKIQHSPQLLLLEYIDNYLVLLESMVPPDPKGDSGITESEAITLGSNLFDIEVTAGLIQKEPERSGSFIRSISSSVEKLKGFLTRNQIEVINHNGESYGKTKKVEVIEWETDLSLKGPIITETIEPTIFFKGKLLKAAKVIVTKND